MATTEKEMVVRAGRPEAAAAEAPAKPAMVTAVGGAVGGLTRDIALVPDSTLIKGLIPQQATLAAVRAALNPGTNPDSSLGFFAFDRLGFGQSISLSAVYATAQAVPGVTSVNVTTFTDPGGPLGESLCMATTLSMRESGNSDV